MPGMELKREEMKERIMNYLEYMDSKDMQDIASTLYNISKRRETKKREDKRRELEDGY